MTTDPATRLEALLVAQAEAWSSGSLVALVEERGAVAPGDELRAHLWAHRAGLGEALTSAGPLLRAQVVRWLRRRNQFIELDAAALAELDALVARGLTAGGRALGAATEAELDAGLRAALRGARAALADFVRARLGPEPREVTSSEYSPTLQLEVLGLRLAELQGPVLDVGCGASAALVVALRAAGLEAEGIDRDASGVGIAADWLRFAYGVDRWGTVVSHLGFSLFLLHHHLGGRPAAFVHAEVYMQVLRSLRVDGVFAYAPGLPFLERLLPRAQYRCTRVELPGSPALRAAQAATGLALGHATQVRRLV